MSMTPQQKLEKSQKELNEIKQIEAWVQKTIQQANEFIYKIKETQSIEKEIDNL